MAFVQQTTKGGGRGAGMILINNSLNILRMKEAVGGFEKSDESVFDRQTFVGWDVYTYTLCKRSLPQAAVIQ